MKESLSSTNMKPILVLWDLEDMISIHAFPFHETILLAHGHFYGQSGLTQVLNEAVAALRLLCRNAPSIDPKAPIVLDSYSHLVISGER